MDLKGKIIVVTGGSGLIGKAILKDLLAKGATPINLDIQECDMDIRQMYCDVTDDQSIQQVLKTVVDEYQRIDGLVNNAYPRTDDWGTEFEHIDANSWRKNIEWQLNSSFVSCREVLSYMVKQKSGSIVNIASIYGIVGNDFSMYEGTNINPPAAYSAIKGGLINFSKYLASKYGHIGIRVNCVSPGGIFDGQDLNFVERYNAKVPMKRMGLPEDIAPSVSFLLSDESRYITGHNLVVDGGWTII